MSRKRFTAEQIVNKLREADVELAKGHRVPEVCRKLGVHEPAAAGTTDGVASTAG